MGLELNGVAMGWIGQWHLRSIHVIMKGLRFLGLVELDTLHFLRKLSSCEHDEPHHGSPDLQIDA